MTKLSISKATEARAIAIIWNMGCESLPPDIYNNLIEALEVLCDTRHINNEVLAAEQIALSGKRVHTSVCSTSGSPALVCGPCDCDA